jgi:hypothetical protein
MVETPPDIFREVVDNVISSSRQKGKVNVRLNPPSHPPTCHAISSCDAVLTPDTAPTPGRKDYSANLVSDCIILQNSLIKILVANCLTISKSWTVAA